MGESTKDIIKEDSDDDDMASIMKDVQQMEEEVKDISQEVEEEGQREKKEKVKKKKKKKDKEKEKVKLKERRKEMKVKDDEKEQIKNRAQEKESENENDKSEKRKGLKESEIPSLTSPTKTIEIDAKLAKKILSSILGSNIGKTLNDVIRKEVNKTDSAIEKIKEEKKKKERKASIEIRKNQIKRVRHPLKEMRNQSPGNVRKFQSTIMKSKIYLRRTIKVEMMNSPKIIPPRGRGLTLHQGRSKNTETNRPQERNQRKLIQMLKK